MNQPDFEKKKSDWFFGVRKKQWTK